MSGSERVNTTLSGSGRIDDVQSHPQGGLRGQTKLVKITEYDRANGARLDRQSKGLPGGRALRATNARQDVRKYAAEQGLAEAEAVESGMKEKSKEFAEKGSALYAKA